jgi:hypothetical protein
VQPGSAPSACSDELFYLWSPWYGEHYPLGPEDAQISQQLIAMWTKFAKYEL